MVDLTVFRNRTGLGEAIDQNRQRNLNRRAAKQQIQQNEDLFKQGQREFDFKRQQAARELQQNRLNPFEGTSQGAQILNELFRAKKEQGLSDSEARRKAIDDFRLSEVRKETFIDPVTGNRITQNVQNKRLFNQDAGEQPQQQTAQGQRLQGQQPLQGQQQFQGRQPQNAPLPPQLQQRQQPQRQQQQPQTQPQQQTGQDISLFKDADLIAGPLSKLQEVQGATTGIFTDLDEETKETIRARQTSTTAVNELIKALSINARNPVSEQERLREEINITPNTFDSPDALRSRMRSIDRSLRNRLEEENKVANNPQIPVKQRQNAIANATQIRQFLNILDVPQNPENGTDPENVTDAEIQRLLDRFAPEDN